jgi:hypothetical protein
LVERLRQVLRVAGDENIRQRGLGRRLLWRRQRRVVRGLCTLPRRDSQGKGDDELTKLHDGVFVLVDACK